MSERAWLTVAEVAQRLHVRPKTAWRIVRIYRERCHLARNGRHPRLVLWVPAAIVSQIERRRWSESATF